MPATLRLRREPPIWEPHRDTFDVLLDGKRAGSVEDHGTFEAPVEAGRHTVQVRTGRYSSPARVFDAPEGDVIAFRCHGARVWPMMLASLAVPSLALKLHRE
jgi:hypothetical protein